MNYLLLLGKPDTEKFTANILLLCAQKARPAAARFERLTGARRPDQKKFP
jgi:hypothetical protein